MMKLCVDPIHDKNYSHTFKSINLILVNHYAKVGLTVNQDRASKINTLRRMPSEVLT